MTGLRGALIQPAAWAAFFLLCFAAEGTAQESPQETAKDGGQESTEQSKDSRAEAADIGPVEAKFDNSNDILQRLFNAERDPGALTKYGPLAILRPPWMRLNNALDDWIGLRLGFSYYLLYQQTSRGPEPDNALAGDMDLFGRWKAFETPDGDRGILGFNFEYRSAFTDIAPSNLAVPIGSLWRTTRGFTDTHFKFNELWWDQQLAEDRVRIRVGTVNPKHFYDLYRYKSQKRFFLSTPFSDTPTIAFPRSGLGARLRISVVENFHINAGVNDANGTRSVGGYDTFFSDGEYFTAFNLVATPSIPGLGTGTYSMTVWDISPRNDEAIPSGHGYAALVQQEIADGIYPFLRYGYGDGANLTVKQFAALGAGLEGPFDQETDVLGFGVNWARPSVAGLRDQWGSELFYRFQITPVLDLTPGVQLILNPSLDPTADAVAVFQVRLGVVL